MAISNAGDGRRTRSSPLPKPADNFRPSAGQETARYSRRLIFDGSLSPGSRVPQDEIAEVMGVSRIPVREALIALERDGWVRIEPHRGAYVNALSAQTVRDHFELFGLVYGWMVRLGTQRASADGVRELASIERALAVAEHHDEVLSLTQHFNAVLTREADSPRVTAVMRGLQALVPGNLFELIPGTADNAKRGMTAMYRSVRKGDSEQAMAACQRMMQQHADAVIRSMKAGGLFDAKAEA